MEELQTGLDFLQSAIPQERKEVSLETLTDEERKKIMNAYIQCRDVAKNYYLETIQPALIKRKDIYDALPKLYRKKFPELSELTDWVSKDVKTAIDWMIPALIDVFCGTDDPCDIRGVDLNDDLAARKLQSIIKYQVNKKNNYFVFLINMLREGLITNEGVAKVYWNRDESREEMEVWIDETNLAEYIQMAQMGQIEIKELEMMGENGLVGGRIKFDKITVHFNAPVLENMSPSELRFTPDGRTLQESKFVAQRKIVKGDYLKRKESEGVFSNVDKAIKEAGDSAWTEYDRKRNDWLDSTGISSLSDNDSASKLVELYEAYIDVDYNNDGVLEKLIVHAVGDTPVSIQENTFRNVPFFIFSPEQDPYSPFGKVSVADALEQLQDLKTALIRQMIIAIGKNNRPQRFVNTSKVDMDSLLDGDEIIPVLDGEPSQAVYSMPHIPLDPATMTMIEYTQNEVESQSGSTKYNQGLDSNSLNKMLALDTPIPLADGTYKLNKDIVEGDMVIGSDGKPIKVLVAHPIQMPERAFEITFQTGDVIKAGGEHRWSVKVSDKWYRNESPDWEKLPTERIFDLINAGCHVKIPRVQRVDFTEKDLPLDPYIFGLWLGDGNAHTNRFTTMDIEIVEAYKKWANQFYKGDVVLANCQHSGKAKTYQLVHTPFRLMLKDLHCLKDNRYKECEGNVKHIPDVYLQGSFEQRLALLQGLMDTDGCIDKNGNAIFCNSEPSLVETFVKLIESFGCKASVNWRQNPSHKFKNARPHAHVIFAMPYCPVRLPHKVSRWKTKKKYWEFQRIVSIKEIPVEPMRCLTVNAKDELYCCGKKMTLTSNTASGINAIMGAADKKLRLIARVFAETAWVPILKHIIKLNQQFLDPYQQFRLDEQMVSIAPEELDIDYDLTVNTGQGAATKEAQMNYLIMLMQQLFPTLQQMGIANEVSWYEATKDLLEKMGIRNVQTYLLDPHTEEFKQLQAQKAEEAQKQATAQIEAMKELQQFKLEAEMQRQSIPRTSMNYKDLPLEAKLAAIKQILGIDIPPQQVVEKEVIDAQKGGR